MNLEESLKEINRLKALICQKDEVLNKIIVNTTDAYALVTGKDALSPTLTSAYVPKEVADKLAKAIKTMLQSASPHPMEHGVMWDAWQEAKKALTAYQSTQEKKCSNQLPSSAQDSPSPAV